jgi:hypothetical protein
LDAQIRKERRLAWLYLGVFLLGVLVLSVF